MENKYVSLKQSEYEEMVEKLNSESRTGLGIIFGLLLGVIGAILWAVVVKVTGYNIGIVAIGVGYLVSEGFVRTGRGTKKSIGIIAGVIALISIFLGEMLTMIVLIAEYWDMSILEAVQNMYISKLPMLVIESTEPISIVFYLIAVRYAYQRSFINENNFNVMIEPDRISEEVV